MTARFEIECGGRGWLRVVISRKDLEICPLLVLVPGFAWPLVEPRPVLFPRTRELSANHGSSCGGQETTGESLSALGSLFAS